VNLLPRDRRGNLLLLLLLTMLLADRLRDLQGSRDTERILRIRVLRPLSRVANPIDESSPLRLGVPAWL